MTLNIISRNEDMNIRRGDIWRLGVHWLMCGDATNRDDVLRLVDGKKADLVLTDPPYGTNKKVQHKDGSIGGKCINSIRSATNKKHSHLIDDNDTDAARLNYEIIKDISDNQIIWGGNFFADFLPPSRCWLILDKKNGGNDFADAELAWTSFDKPIKIFHFLWSGCCREGSHRLNLRVRVHPTQKPVEVHMKILEDYSRQGDLILDCFGGSGTTLIAADQCGRQCNMMELSEDYIKIIISRWETLNLDRAELIERTNNNPDVKL